MLGISLVELLRAFKLFVCIVKLRKACMEFVMAYIPRLPQGGSRRWQIIPDCLWRFTGGWRCALQWCLHAAAYAVGPSMCHSETWYLGLEVEIFFRCGNSHLLAGQKLHLKETIGPICCYSSLGLSSKPSVFLTLDMLAQWVGELGMLSAGSAEHPTDSYSTESETWGPGVEDPGRDSVISAGTFPVSLLSWPSLQVCCFLIERWPWQL